MKKKQTEEVCFSHILFKASRIMRLTLGLILILFAQGWATKSYSQKAVLDLNMKNVTIVDVLEEVENQTDYYFLFNYEQVHSDKKISVRLTNSKIDDVLDYVLKGTGLKYLIKDRQIIISTDEMEENRSELSFYNQQIRSISGKVTDSSGSPLPGVTVVVKGTTNGTITDTGGNYSLSNIPENAVLVFSFVGMRSQEVQATGKTNIQVVMKEETIGLEEVVAVGYGVQKKVNMTGSISTVKFDQELENRPITNASQALGGSISGVWVSQNSGKPGSDEAQVRVRGWGTLNNSNPLIIIDGVEGSFSQINPNDIESISVLKDAASAAIYGSKAANGVILVTTKMGNTNEKMQVNLTSYIGVQSLGRRYDMIDNSAEYMERWNQALSNDGSNPLFPDYMIENFRNGNDPYKYPNTNWFDVLFEDAIIQEHNVSIMGGTAQSSSFLSFNYLNQDGMVPNTQSERYGIRANLESNINDWLKVSGRLNYTRKISEEPYADITYGSLGRVFEMLGGATSFIAPYTKDGRFGSVEAITKDGIFLYDNRNPLIDAANGKTKKEDNFISVNASVDIRFNENLHFKTTLSSNGNWAMTDKYNESIFGYTDSGMETTTKNFNREGLEINRAQVSTMNNNFFATLNFDRNITENHHVAAIAGMQMESFDVKNVYARRTEAPKEGLTQVDAGTSGIQGEGNLVGYRMFSYFGRTNYSFMDKYLFEVNLRADASSRFKKGSRWGIFPGFSAGWRLIDEKFIKDVGIFSNAKLRASWGQLGNQNIAGYWPYLTVIDQKNSLSYSYNGSFVPGAAVTSLIDENITWETTSTLDFGLDLGFWENKLNIEADYFKKTTRDIIVQLPIPLIMGGIAAPYENVGEMVNNGFELTVNFDNQVIDRNRLRFNIGLNMTYIENEVTKFRDGDSPDQLYLIREGYSYQTLYGYKVEGIYQSDTEALEHMYDNSYKPKAGNLRFEDVNNDGKLGFEDKQDLGNTIPKFTFGLTPSFKYKGFDLDLLIQGISGVHAFTQNLLTTFTADNPTLTKRWRDAWTSQNTATDVPSVKLDNSWDNSQSSYWVSDISFIKLKNIQLGSSLPTTISDRLGLHKIYLYANAQNVFSLVNKDYQGYDPERDTFTSAIGVYPTPRIISFGINLNF